MAANVNNHYLLSQAYVRIIKEILFHMHYVCIELNKSKIESFVQMGFNLSNGVTDTLESSSILIYFETRKSILTR